MSEKCAPFLSRILLVQKSNFSNFYVFCLATANITMKIHLTTESDRISEEFFFNQGLLPFESVKSLLIKMNVKVSSEFTSMEMICNRIKVFNVYESLDLSVQSGLKLKRDF